MLVNPSRVTKGLCHLASGTSEWSSENILLLPDTNEHGYKLGLPLKHTLCGDVLKGEKVTKVDAYEKTCAIDDLLIQKNESSLWVQTDERVAIKIDRRQSMKRLHNKKSTMTNPENPWKEVAALQLLGNTHPNVINLLDVFVDDECLYEVLQYCSGGSLNEYMRHNQNGISEVDARRIFVQIILGLYHIHSHGVCHHDLSADNVMLDGNDLKCIIIDFGMCLRVPYSYPDDSGATDDTTDESMGTIRRLIHSNNHCGKLRYMAPEIYAKKDAFDGLAADIWSAGVVLFMMITGRLPYERPSIEDSGFFDLVDERFYWDTKVVNPLMSWGCEISSELVDLLMTMLRPNPRERATLSQILKHRWLSSID
jgi:serine/threonine protein kinase